MRNLVILMLALVSGVVLGQKKPNINKAKGYLDKGEYVAAQEEIDRAIEYEKTMGKAKTWYYRGMIYAALDTALNQEGATDVVLASFAKASSFKIPNKSLFRPSWLRSQTFVRLWL